MQSLLRKFLIIVLLRNSRNSFEIFAKFAIFVWNFCEIREIRLKFLRNARISQKILDLRFKIVIFFSQKLSTINFREKLKLSTLVRSQELNWYRGWCSRVRFPHSLQSCGFKIIWSPHLVKQLWVPNGWGRTEGRLSTSLAAKGFVLSTQQERSLKWMYPSECC